MQWTRVALLMRLRLTLQVKTLLSLPVNLTGTGGNGTINTNGSNVASLGGLSGVGGLTKIGNGALTIQGAGSYTGGTSVAAGSIVASGTSLGGGVVSLAGGTTLQIAGIQQVVDFGDQRDHLGRQVAPAK